MKFSQVLTELRKERGFSQRELAKALDVSNAVISYWESGRNEPTLQMLKRIAQFFCVNTDYLLGLEDEFGNKVDLGERAEFKTPSSPVTITLTQEQLDALLNKIK